jgi:hypothetical protein
MVSRYLEIGLALVFCLSGTAQAFDSMTSIVIARQLQTRLIGKTLPPSHPTTVAMLTALASGTTDATLQSAAKIATEHPGFPRRVLRDYFAMMQNLDLSHEAVPFNKAVAYAVAKSIQGDVRQIFYGNETCLLKDYTGAIVDPEALDNPANANIDLRTNLVCTPKQKAMSAANSEGVEIDIPDYDAMGMFSLGGDGSFSQTVFSMGTNLRFGFLILSATFGEDYSLANLRSTKYRDHYIGPFVDRNPAGRGTVEYQNNCVSCHGLHGSFSPCRHWTYSRGVVYDPDPEDRKTKCNGSNADKGRATYPGGFIRTDNGWFLAFNESASTALGFKGPRYGYGLNALGKTWASIPRVYANFIERILWDRNGVCVGVEVDAPTLSARASELQATGDIVTQFIKAAASRNCLGIK